VMSIYSNGSDKHEFSTSTKVKRASIAFIFASTALVTATVFAEEAKVILEATTPSAKTAITAITNTTQRELANKGAAQSAERAGREMSSKSESGEAARIREGHRKLRPTVSDASEQLATF
jgi:hypothetical protein